MGTTQYLLHPTLTLATETCYSCGVLFAMPEEMQARLIQSRASFWCPNGHQQAYIGKTEEQKLREQLEQAERQRNYAQGRAARLTEDLEHERRSKAAVKGHLTRIRVKIANGLCPCCRRHFTNVEQHMKGQHPEFLEARNLDL